MTKSILPYKIIALKTEKGYDLLAWRKGEISKKEARSLCKRFMKDSDVLHEVVMDWDRFYTSLSEMKKELPEV